MKGEKSKAILVPRFIWNLVDISQIEDLNDVVSKATNEKVIEEIVQFFEILIPF